LSVALNVGDVTREFVEPERITRVLIVADAPAAAARLHRLLEGGAAVQVVGRLAGTSRLASSIAVLSPDVVLWHVGAERALHVNDTPEVPLVVIVDQPEPAWIHEFLSGKVRALLLGDASSAELVAAIQCAVSGLVTLSPKLRAFLRPGILTADENEYAEHLTGREQEVLEMMMEGLSNKEIAMCLNVSTHTVKFHISSVLGKLGASTRTEAITIGLRRGLITI
jgi:DNA-binding NarL/FixJ family response regulator